MLYYEYAHICILYYVYKIYTVFILAWFINITMANMLVATTLLILGDK